MSQEWTIEWVGDRPREWQGRHGRRIDYYVGLEGYHAARAVKITQKPETPAPQAGQTVYGYVTVDVVQPKNGGEPFEVHKLVRERRPDFQKAPGPQAVLPRTPSSGPGEAADKPDGSYWAAKDERIARAGMLQAVIQSPQLRPPQDVTREKYIAWANDWADALLASLDAKAPHPSRSREDKNTIDPPLPTQDTGAGNTGNPEPAPAALSDDEDIPF